MSDPDFDAKLRKHYQTAYDPVQNHYVRIVGTESDDTGKVLLVVVSHRAGSYYARLPHQLTEYCL